MATGNVAQMEKQLSSEMETKKERGLGPNRSLRQNIGLILGPVFFCDFIRDIC